MMTVSPWVRLRFAVHRHGWPAVVGVLLLAAAWLLSHIVADGTRAQADELRASVAAQRARAPAPPDPRRQDAALAALFVRELPDATAALESVQLIHERAADHGVALASGEYRFVRDAATGVQRYQITLPAEGRYPALRAWLADVVNALPTIALDELSVSRRDIGDPQVQARVRWSLYLQSP